MFSPNYGAASSHIEKLMAEREDFVAAAKSQAHRIKDMEAVIKGLKEELRNSAESEDGWKLIAESRARTSW